MSKDEMWTGVVVIGVIYLLISDVKEYIKNIKCKLRTKSIRESIIYATIDKKYFREGGSYNCGGNTVRHAKLPDSYIINCSSNKRTFTINDKKIFEKYKVNDTIQLKLIEKLDKDNCVISYKVTNV